MSAIQASETFEIPLGCRTAHAFSIGYEPPAPSGSGGSSECDFEVLGESLGASIDRVATLVATGNLVPAFNDDGYEILAMTAGGDVRRLIRGERQRRT